MQKSVNTQASLHENATDQPPGVGEIWNCILKGHKSVKKNVKQSKVCGVAGVKSDGMFTQGI